MNRKSRKEFHCAITGCWKMVNKEGRLCTACSSWWYRVQMLTAPELGRYIQKYGRFASRLGTPRFAHLNRPKLRVVAGGKS